MLADRKNKFIFEINPHIFGADYLTGEESLCWRIFYSDKDKLEAEARANRETR